MDGESVRAGAKAAEPADYPMPPMDHGRIDGVQITVDRNLNLRYLAFGPIGGVLRTEVKETHLTGSDGSDIVKADGLDAGMLYITDNTGRELYTSKSASIGGDAVNLTAPDENAVSLTLTPVIQQFTEDGEWMGEDRTVTLEALKKGVKIETSPIGGYTVENFTIQDGAISYDLKPYGWNPARSGEVLRPQDDGKITEVEEAVTGLQGGETATFLKSGLLSSIVDPQTGVISFRYDYYAATDAELNTITEWKYSYTEMKLDTEHAVTVQLNPLES